MDFNPSLLFAYAFGAALLILYVAAAVFCAKFAWKAAIDRYRWLRGPGTSFVLAIFFAPGFVAAGHGVGFAPAWLMFATGTYDALTSESKTKALLIFPATWAVLFCLIQGYLLMAKGKPGQRQTEEKQTSGN